MSRFLIRAINMIMVALNKVGVGPIVPDFIKKMD